MTTDQVLYFGTAVRLAGINSFYARRILQRCERGEISLEVAAELLMSAAQGGHAHVELIGVRTMGTERLSPN
jgi:hypothetical protein